MFRSSVLALTLSVALVAPGLAADERVEVTTVDRDQPLKGRLSRVDPDGTLHLTSNSGEVLRVPGTEVVTVVFPDARASRGRVRLDLVGDDVLFGSIKEAAEDGVVLTGTAFSRVVVPLERVRVLQLPEALERLKERPLLTAGDGRDVVFRRLKNNVDRVTGTVDRIGPDGVTVETSLGDLSFGFDRVVAVAFAAPDAARSPTGLHTVVLGADGSRLTGVLKGLQGGEIVLETPHGFTVGLALAHVRTLLFKGGSFDFLSDLDPIKVEERSFFPGVVWNYRRDRTTTGKPLTLMGIEYPKGLGVHAYCALTYRLDGRYRRLRSWIGIDDEVRVLKAKGAVVFRAVVDGKQAYESPLIRGLEPPTRIPDVSLEGAKELVLIVDFGDDSHAGDRADWAMALLVKK